MKEQETTITKKGQVTIPVEVRRALGLKPRDKVIFELQNEGKVARIRPAQSKVQRWYGAVSAKQQPVDFKQLRETFEEQVAEEVTGETK